MANEAGIVVGQDYGADPVFVNGSFSEGSRTNNYEQKRLEGWDCAGLTFYAKTGHDHWTKLPLRDYPDMSAYMAKVHSPNAKRGKPRPGNSRILQAVPGHIPGESYCLSFLAATAQGNDAILRVVVDGKELIRFTPSTTCQRYDVNYTTSCTAPVFIFENITAESNRGFFLTDLVIHKLPAITAKFANADFAEGSSTGGHEQKPIERWNSVGQTFYFCSGAKSFDSNKRSAVSGTHFVGLANDSSISQTVENHVEGQQYCLSFWTCKPTGSKPSGNSKLRVLVDGVELINVNPPNHILKEYHVNYTASNALVDFKFECTKSGGGGTQYVCLDAVEISAGSATSAEVELINTFKTFDTDNSGVLSFDEFRSVLKTLNGDMWTDANIDQLLANADKNRDGQIQLSEFLAWIMGEETGAVSPERLSKLLEEWDDRIRSSGNASDAPLEVGMTFPAYWDNSKATESFDQRCLVPYRTREQIQELIDGTFKNIRTRDRQGGLPGGIRVLKAHRIEDSAMWARYHEAKMRINRKRDGKVTPVGKVKTTDLLQDGFADRLDEDVGEHYLFHGSTPEGAYGISVDGFKISFAGSHAGTMFGKGAYFAECSSKADEYARSGEDLFEGVYAMLLCRVACGEPFHTEQPDLKAIEQALFARTADFVLGDREKARGTYREFVVFDQEVVYPEYVLLYERVPDEEGKVQYVEDLAIEEAEE